MIIFLTIVVLVISGALLVQGATAPVLREAPRRGELRPGQTVLVDDGSCPTGQLHKITGGTTPSSGARPAIPTSRARAAACRGLRAWPQRPWPRADGLRRQGASGEAMAD